MTKSKTLWYQQAWFLILLPFFFILHGNNQLFGFLPISFVTINLVAVLFGTALVYLLSFLLLRHPQKAVLFSFWLLLMILLFGGLHDFLKSIFHGGFFSSYRFVLPFLGLLFLIFLILLKKRNAELYRTFLFLNLLCTSLCIYEIADSLIQNKQLKQGAHLLDNRFSAFHSYQKSTLPDTSKPDIYFLVFDAMPSTKAMQASWNFNNSGLDQFLQSRQFWVNTDSKSNYNLTVLSVASTLNMDYTPPINLQQDETKMYFKASASILDNSLTRILQQEGYSIHQYQPVSFQNKDWKGALFFEDMQQKHFFYKTLPGRMFKDIGWNLSRLPFTSVSNKTAARYEKMNQQRTTDLRNTIQLVKNSCAVEKTAPQFVYAHFQLPHDPYIFDSVGHQKPFVEMSRLSEEAQAKAFIEQVKYTNKVIADLVVQIQTKNKKNTIIIIEGDHGFRNHYGQKGYMIYDNLNTVYFPDGDYQTVYNSMSPVNSFRSVLNKYFKAKLPLLKDSSIFIPYTLPGEK